MTITDTDYTRTAHTLIAGDLIADSVTFSRIDVENVAVRGDRVTVIGTMLVGRDDNPAGPVVRTFRRADAVTVYSRPRVTVCAWCDSPATIDTDSTDARCKWDDVRYFPENHPTGSARAHLNDAVITLDTPRHSADPIVFYTVRREGSYNAGSAESWHEAARLAESLAWRTTLHPETGAPSFDLAGTDRRAPRQ